ncbi:RnfH family protein [Stenotrophomonas sp. HITSZ_GD]|uniref:RnfH family protein n=1 Tax=Stenotrophomonas sp. HITSZ_GD TaxID=3037248 RepID=UPI00240D6C55|nr:RnfH family protein [Stenotrophomonas sp. HITSZ_GD]MDG2526586.1 RnfH family protein [Stenotrophomonas sp. HITSZ_GD]
MRVEVIIAWPDHYAASTLELAEGATVAEAIAAAHLPRAIEAPGVAVHGLVVRSTQVLHDGDRVELLRPLLADPKEARRRRAGPMPGVKRG